MRSEKDLELAKHIAYVHQHSTQPPSEVRALPMRLVRRYVALTKRKNPAVPNHLTDYIVCEYRWYIHPNMHIEKKHPDMFQSSEIAIIVT